MRKKCFEIICIVVFVFLILFLAIITAWYFSLKTTINPPPQPVSYEKLEKTVNEIPDMKLVPLEKIADFQEYHYYLTYHKENINSNTRRIRGYKISAYFISSESGEHIDIHCSPGKSKIYQNTSLSEISKKIQEFYKKTETTIIKNGFKYTFYSMDTGLIPKKNLLELLNHILA